MMVIYTKIVSSPMGLIKISFLAVLCVLEDQPPSVYSRIAARDVGVEDW
jgi:hypothetical protein